MSRPAFTVVTGWLEGGGGQSALEGLLATHGLTGGRLVVLFRGSHDYQTVADHFAEVMLLEKPRSPLGLLEAVRALKGILSRDADVPLYSLMRSSHVVLGLLPVSLRRGLAMTFHASHHADQEGIRGKLEGLLVARTAKHAVLITAPTLTGLAELRAVSLGGCSTQLVHEPNVVRRTGRPLAAPTSGQLENVRLLFAGRLEPEKGADRLRTLLERASIPTSVEVVGDGSLRPALERDARALDGKPHQIHVRGYVEDVFSHIDEADAVVVPSREELLGMTILEAFNRGRPALVQALPSLAHWRGDKRIIWFTDATFDEAITRLSSDEQTRRAAFRLAVDAETEPHVSHLADYLRGRA